MSTPIDPIEEIKNKLDIVDVIGSYIQLTQAGKNFKALCPFHKEKTPSFIVSPERQSWHCFGACNQGGDVISFVMKYENLEFFEALEVLAKKAGIELKRISPSSQKEFGVLYDINALAKDYFVGQRSDPLALEYLYKRGLKEEILDEFEIGYAPNKVDDLTRYLVNAGFDVADIQRAGLTFKTEKKTFVDRFRGRIIFPIYNTFGKIVGFSGRILPVFDDGQLGKYVNSPETPIFNKSKVLYGLHKTKQNIRDTKTAILVEGQMDFLMLYQDGVTNVAATSGTALTWHHLEVIKKLANNLVLSFDNDDAGMIAAERAIDMAHSLDFNVSIFILENAKDAAEYIQKNPGSIKRLIDSKSISALDFYFRGYLENISDSEIKKNARHILEKVFYIYSPTEQSLWIKKIAQKIGVPESALFEEFNILKSKRKTNVNLNEPLQSESKAGSSFDLKTRAERIAFEIIMLALADESQIAKLDDYKTFFPERFLKVIDFLRGEKIDDSKIKELADIAQMKSSLLYGDIDLERIPYEINVLVKELKKEFYKEKRDILLKEIKLAEKSGDKEKSIKLLKEFDELSKLVNN
jgi:DNA primase